MSALDRDTEWLEARIARTKTLIEALEDAIEALTTGGVDMYQLDTGQTRTYVQKSRLPSLRDWLSSAENRLAVLEAKCYGATIIGVPGF